MPKDRESNDGHFSVFVQCTTTNPSIPHYCFSVSADLQLPMTSKSMTPCWLLYRFRTKGPHFPASCTDNRVLPAEITAFICFISYKCIHISYTNHSIFSICWNRRKQKYIIMSSWRLIYEAINMKVLHC